MHIDTDVGLDQQLAPLEMSRGSLDITAPWHSTKLSGRGHPLDRDSSGRNVTQAFDSMNHSFVGLNRSEIQNLKSRCEFLDCRAF
jgi:hypothetical protein